MPIQEPLCKWRTDGRFETRTVATRHQLLRFRWYQRDRLISEFTQASHGALGQPSPVDITTTGRTSRQPRRIEICAHLIEDRIFITNSPERRNCSANMLAQPDIVLHFKDGTKTASRTFSITSKRGSPTTRRYRTAGSQTL